MSTPTDGELLRFIAHCALGHIHHLIGEGLEPDALEEVRGHATALTGRDADLDVHPDEGRRHAFGVWQLLVALPGPVAQTLVSWVEEVFGSFSGEDAECVGHVDPSDVGEPHDAINRALGVLARQRDADPADGLQLLLRWSTATGMGILDVADLVVVGSDLLRGPGPDASVDDG